MPMNILIAGSIDAYANREEKAFVEEIVSIVKKGGNNADYFYLPFHNDLYSIPQQMLSLRLLTIGLESDILLTVGYPAFALKHPKKFSFVLGLSSQFHEYWNSEYGALEEFYMAERLQNLQKIVWNAEQTALCEAKEVFCSTRMLQQNIQQELEIKSNLFSFSASEKANGDHINTDSPYILVESNLAPHQRIELILDAVSRLNTNFRLCLFIPNCQTMYRKALEARAERLMIAGRIEIHEGYASINAIKNARAIICAGYMQTRIQSYLYQSADCGKPVIVLQDGGGLTELSDAYSGIIVAKPEAADLAHAMDKAVKMKDGHVKSVKKDQSIEIGNILKWVVK